VKRFSGLLSAVAAVSAANAETIVLRPDTCPAAPEQPLIIDLGDVELFNENPEAAFGRVFVIYPPLREGWASARILMRFDLEGPIPQPTPADCRQPRLFRSPG
jgi:hypothetical protein